MIYNTKICKYCHTEFANIEGRVFSNHVRWCDNNPNSKNTKKLANAIRTAFTKRDGKYKNFTVQCNRCSNPVVVCEREKLHPIKLKYFCSRSCANTREHTTANKNKIRVGVIRYLEKNGKEYNKFHVLLCGQCGKQFESKLKTQIYCGKDCHSFGRRKRDGLLSTYRRRAAFHFALSDFPDEFDFGLIRKYGWYQAKNHGDNMIGVSRDHMVSVRFGYDHSIDPEIIAHPANCQLMQQSKNSSKFSMCSLTIVQLLVRIDQWDEKYPNWQNNSRLLYEQKS